jgi:hypothetical protein
MKRRGLILYKTIGTVYNFFFISIWNLLYLLATLTSTIKNKDVHYVFSQFRKSNIIY